MSDSTHAGIVLWGGGSGREVRGGCASARPEPNLRGGDRGLICSGPTAPNGAGQVAVRFNTASSGRASTSVSNSGAQFSTAATAALSIAGENGTLVIEDIRLIVSEMELERAEGACVSAGDDDECEEFEGGPFLVNLLDGSADQVVSALIPAGSYTEFEVEDLEVDDDDAAEQQTIQALLSEMRQVHPNFPSNASMW